MAGTVSAANGSSGHGAKGKVVVVTAGARGDIEPYAAVCWGLQRRGYEVLLLANPEYETLITELGIPYKSLEWRFKEIFQTRQVIKHHMTNGYMEIIKAVYAHRRSQATKEYEIIYKAIEEFKPDLVLLGTFYNDMRYWLPMVLDVPALLMVTAVRHLNHFENPPLATSLSLTDSPLATVLYWIDKSVMKSALNENKKAYAELIEKLSGRPVDDWWPTTMQFLGLLGWDATLTWWPIIGAFEKEMQENRCLYDLPQYVYLGYPMLPEEACVGEEFGASQLNEIEAFLSAGPPPVLLTWGSLTVCTPKAMTRLAVRALQIAKIRGIIVQGWAGLDLGLLEKDADIEKISTYCKENVLFVKTASFMTLIPRCSLVIHHGGAGTTMVAARCGVPQVVTPAIYDQHDYGSMVAKTAIIGGLTCNISELSPEVLAVEIRTVLESEEIHNRAEDMSDQLRMRHYYNHVVDYVDDFIDEKVKTGTFMDNIRELQSKNRVRKKPSKIFRFKNFLALIVLGMLVPFVNRFAMGPRDHWVYFLPRLEHLITNGNHWLQNKTGGHESRADWMHQLRAKDCNLLKWKPGNSLLSAFKGMATRAKATGKPCYFVEDAPDMWVEIIRRDQPLTYVRYNEGEWTAIEALKDGLGDHFCALNYDSMPCPESMVKRINTGISNVTWTIHQPPQGFQYIIQSGLEATQRDHWNIRAVFWLDDAMQDIVRNHPAHLEAWAVHVRKHPLLIVGPCSYRRFCHKLPYDKFVEIPAYHQSIPSVMQSIITIKNQVLDWMDELEEQEEERRGIILMAAGLMTKAIATDLYPYTKGHHYLIDIGSALDPLIDDPDRNGKRRMPHGDPENIRPCYTGYKQCPAGHDATDLLSELVPEVYGESSEDELHDALRSWLVGEGEHRSSCKAVCEFDVGGAPLKKGTVWLAQLTAFLVGGSTIFWLIRSCRDDGTGGHGKRD